MPMPTEELLLSLGWPPESVADTGTLSWTKSFGKGLAARLVGASVVVTHGAIACRMRSARLVPPYQMEPHVESVWDIRPGRPYLRRWVVDGEPRDVFAPDASEQALAHFRSTVRSLGIDPVFEKGPGRQTDPAWVSH